MLGAFLYAVMCGAHQGPVITKTRMKRKAGVDETEIKLMNQLKDSMSRHLTGTK